MIEIKKELLDYVKLKSDEHPNLHVGHHVDFILIRMSEIEKRIEKLENKTSYELKLNRLL